MADPALRVLSLFTGGLAGLDRGLHAGLRDVGRASRVVGYVEIEAFAVACLVAAMERGALAPAPVWLGDVGRLACPAADLVVGGFPCPPVSCAGKRAGTEDDRWLWPEVVRVVRDSGASWLFVENVRGLLTANDGRAFGSMLGDLADLGFDAEWTVYSAADVGAPHRRERVFLLAHRDGAGLGILGRPDGDEPEPAPGDDADGRGGNMDDPAQRDQHGEREGDASVRGRWVLIEAGARATGRCVGDDARLAEREPDDGQRAIARADARADASGAGGLLADGNDPGRGEQRGAEPGQAEHASAEHASAEHAGCHVVNAMRGGSGGTITEREGDGGGMGADALRPSASGFPLRWPPGPGERDRWRDIIARDPDLAPATLAHVRRVAHGGPEGLDVCLCPRTDRLRVLGNGVVAECARAAFRELWERMT